MRESSNKTIAHSLLPNKAQYQLRYTRIFAFSVSGNSAVYGQNCGQTQFLGLFQIAVKLRKCSCVNGFWEFRFLRPGQRRGPRVLVPQLPCYKQRMRLNHYNIDASGLQGVRECVIISFREVKHIVRMRKKPNLAPRMERCAALLVKQPEAQKGNWRTLMPGACLLYTSRCV